jgi:hypothetical protein
LKTIFLFVVLVFSFEFVQAKGVRSKNDEVSKGMGREEFALYMADCRKMILEMHPEKVIDDVWMLCSDPYLNGKPFETKTDKARRKRLIREADTAKKEVMSKHLNPSSDMDPADFTKLCTKLLLEADPGKDPADAHMLCTDPYLNGKPNESRDDEVRRKRLIEETNQAKNKMMEKYVVPAGSNSKDTSGGGRQ